MTPIHQPTATIFSLDSFLPTQGPAAATAPLVEAPKSAAHAMSYKQRMLERIDHINNRLFSLEEGLIDSGYQQINTALGGGIYPGLYLLPGQTNIGKTAFMMNLALSIAQHNKDVAAVYFTLDEGEIGVFPKIVSILAQIPINAVKYPQRYVAEKGMLQRRQQGLEKLKELAKDGRFVMYASGDGDGTVEWIVETVRSIMIEDENMRPCVFIDFLNDLRTKERIDDKQLQLQYIVDVLMRLARGHDIPIFLTAELRKLNRRPGARPTLDDIRETVRTAYKMDAIFMMFNDVDATGSSAKVYWEQPGFEGKRPVIEAAILKTRFGSKRTLFFNFIPEQGRVVEPTEAAIREYFTRLTS